MDGTAGFVQNEVSGCKDDVSSRRKSARESLVPVIKITASFNITNMAA